MLTKAVCHCTKGKVFEGYSDYTLLNPSPINGSGMIFSCARKCGNFFILRGKSFVKVLPRPKIKQLRNN